MTPHCTLRDGRWLCELLTNSVRHLELPRQEHLVNRSIKQTAASGQVLWWCKANKICSLLEVHDVCQVKQEQGKSFLKSHSALLCV